MARLLCLRNKIYSSFHFKFNQVIKLVTTNIIEACWVCICVRSKQRFLLEQTPREFDVPLDVDNEEKDFIGQDVHKTVASKLTLDKFLLKNTSEDNASFEKIMEATREKQREKLSWLHQQQRELHERLDASRALPSSAQEQFLALENKPNNLDTWKYVARNALMYTPDGVQLTADEFIQSKGKKEKEIRHENTR